ncbi:MAG: hypothetical protein LUG48_17005, partial [Klebsiella quasipneumoniae]|nr:hypothetical protein [Klebsiella quasipneumoniae]
FTKINFIEDPASLLIDGCQKLFWTLVVSGKNPAAIVIVLLEGNRRSGLGITIVGGQDARAFRQVRRRAVPAGGACRLRPRVARSD